jgi:hypothetical protein
LGCWVDLPAIIQIFLNFSELHGIGFPWLCVITWIYLNFPCSSVLAYAGSGGRQEGQDQAEWQIKHHLRSKAFNSGASCRDFQKFRKCCRSSWFDFFLDSTFQCVNFHFSTVLHWIGFVFNEKMPPFFKMIQWESRTLRSGLF